MPLGQVRIGGPQGTLLRTVWYTYYKTGDVSNITLKDEYVEGLTSGERAEYTWYHDLALYGTTHGNIAMAVKSRWQLDGEGRPTNYTREWARQFAYDDPRARFMDRDVDPGTYEPNFADPAANRWTDYAGVLPWGDFALSFSGGQPVTSEKVRYLGTAGHQKVSDGSKQYYHGDLIDSVWMATAGDATPAGFASYTAFGELLDSSGSPGGHGASPGGDGLPAGPPAGFGRYQYAGGWGYESPAGEGFPGAPGGLILAGVNPNLPPLTLLHVGARWYDPSLGRFIQRDPIGLDGGLNVYAYVLGEPVIWVDPSGEGFWDGDNWFHDWIARNFWLRFHSPEYIQSPWATAEAVGLSVAGGLGAGPAVGRLVATCVPRAWNPWIGTAGIHPPHHGLGPHVEVIIRWIGGKNIKVIFPGKGGGPWIGIR